MKEIIVIVFAVLFAPFGCQIMVSLGDTLVWKVTKSHNKHNNKAIARKLH